MLVGDKNGVTAIKALARRAQASRDRFPAKARVHHQARLLRANPGGVAATAAAQHANPYAQLTLPALLGRARWPRAEIQVELARIIRQAARIGKAKTPSRGRAGCGMFSA